MPDRNPKPVASLVALAALLAACHAVGEPRSDSRSAPPSPVPSGMGAAGAASGTPAPVATVEPSLFHRIADAPVSYRPLRGGALLSDFSTVAVPRGDGFVQDGALSSVPGCSRTESFAAFAGTPEAPITLRTSTDPREGDRVLAWTKDRWKPVPLRGERALLAPWGQRGGLLVTWKDDEGYALRTLGGEKAPQPTKGGKGCRTSVVSPAVLATSSRGDVVLLGKACEGGVASRMEHFSPDEPGGRVIDAPSGLVVTAFSIDGSGALVAGGSRGEHGIVATEAAGQFTELPPLPGETVVGVARDASGVIWAVLGTPEVPVARNPHFDDEAPPRTVNNVRRFDGSGSWKPVSLPDGSGAARAITADAGAMWITTDRELLASTPRPSMTWAHWWLTFGGCPRPVTGSATQTYRKVGRARPVEWNQNVAGTCANHFVLIDSSTEPTSKKFEDAIARFDGTYLADELAEGAQAVKRDRAGGTGFRSVHMLPVVTFELGRYLFGFQLGLQAQKHSVAITRMLAGRIEREACALPLPLRL
jgi:hypothetical protein